jgi:hypothetical protein
MVGQRNREAAERVMQIVPWYSDARNLQATRLRAPATRRLWPQKVRTTAGSPRRRILAEHSAEFNGPLA